MPSSSLSMGEEKKFIWLWRQMFLVFLHSFCYKLPFQECLQNEHPWDLDRGSLRGRGQICFLTLTTKGMFSSGARAGSVS